MVGMMLYSFEIKRMGATRAAWLQHEPLIEAKILQARANSQHSCTYDVNAEADVLVTNLRDYGFTVARQRMLDSSSGAFSHWQLTIGW